MPSQVSHFRTVLYALMSTYSQVKHKTIKKSITGYQQPTTTSITVLLQAM
jgi:hypothetical protein